MTAHFLAVCSTVAVTGLVIGCIDGIYGAECMCKDPPTFDESSGSGECPEGCQGKFMEPQCPDCPAAPERSNWEVPVVAALGVNLVFALMALLITIIYIGRLKKQVVALRKEPEDHYMSLDATTRDPVVESVYEETHNTVF